MVEVLDWWRVYVALLAGLLLGAGLLWAGNDAPWASMAAITTSAAGLVAGLLWHARAHPRP